MASAQGKGFPDLPTELILNVFAFVRSHADRSAISLVCHRWSDAVAPIMYETINMDLKNTASKKFPKLLHSNSRILSHIRSLMIYKEDCNEVQGEGEDEDDQEGGSSVQLSASNMDDSHQLRLLQLILALPEDRLQAFSTSKRSTMPTLRCLLEYHKTLTYLHLTDISSLSLPEQSARMAASLSSVMIFELSIPTKLEAANASLQNCRTFIKNMPRLTWLMIRRDDPSYPGSSRLADLSNLLLDDSSTLSFSCLERLSLYSINVSLASALLLTRIDFARIKVLDLRRCAGVDQLLDRLAVFYSSHEGAALHSFSLELGPNPSGHVIHTLEEFLGVCPALGRLYINVCRSDLIRTTPITTRHSKTLYSLTLATGDFPFIEDGRSHPVEDIKNIIGACVKLEGLAIDLPKSDMGPLEALGAGFRLRDNDVRKEEPKTKLEAFLEAISAHSNLHTLRIYNLPVVQYNRDDSPSSRHKCEPVTDEEINMTKIVFQHFADQVMRFLSVRGSNIRIFHLRPFLGPPKRPRKDTNGHEWPTYTYTKGRATGSEETDDVVARPLANAATELAEEALVF